MSRVLKNTSVHAGLLAILIIFTLMIVVGATMDVLALRITNAVIERVHAISDRSMLLNDTYKDMQRTHTGMSRLYSVLRGNVDETAKMAALASSEKDLKKATERVKAFRNTSRIEGVDESLRQAIVQAAQTHIEAVQHALAALHTNDAAAYTQLDYKGVTDTDAAWSMQVESFQQLVKKLAKDEADDGHTRYETILRFVALGITMALVLIMAAFYGLRVLVITPLNGVVAALNRVAKGDLTIHVKTGGRNELGRLLAAVGRIHESLMRTVRQMHNSSDSVNTGTHGIASSNLSLSSCTGQQSASLERTAASMEQMTSTVTNNSENIRQASTLASNIADLTSHDGEVVHSVVATMNDISTGLRRMVDIIGVIDGIAFQTSILALNAAVGAVRAGKQGRSFVVVASETRVLAQRSAAAVKKIKTLISDSVSHVQAGHSQVAQAGEIITETAEAVRYMTDIAKDVASASAEQTQGILQIGQAVTEMERAAQQSAALVEQAAVAAQSLGERAQNLAQVVSQFRLGGAKTVALVVQKQEKMAKSAAKATAKPVNAAKPARVALRKRELKTSVQPAASAPVAVVTAASTAVSAHKQPLAVADGGSDADWETF